VVAAGSVRDSGLILPPAAPTFLAKTLAEFAGPKVEAFALPRWRVIGPVPDVAKALPQPPAVPTVLIPAITALPAGPLSLDHGRSHRPVRSGDMRMRKLG
jgi:hypothetical protein